MAERNVKILLVDDDSIDRRAVCMAFKKEKISNEIIEAKHGEEALDILRGTNGYEKIKGPYVVLLDINMPVMGGHEFLTEVREDPYLHHAIVFMLTTSNSDQDRHKAYQQHVSGYLLKDQIGSDFMTKIRMLDLFMVSIQFPDPPVRETR